MYHLLIYRPWMGKLGHGLGLLPGAICCMHGFGHFEVGAREVLHVTWRVLHIVQEP